MKNLKTARRGEKGAITLVETLIVIGIATAVLLAWAAHRSNELTQESARQSGRIMAAFSSAAAEWLTDSPPATAGNYGIASLQDCTDPTGPRFLSCNYSSDTRLPFAFSAPAGTPVDLGSLVITVALNPAGASGEIDFGIMRSGDDANDDGLPDSRPDLAAIAHHTASEETGAGVSDFFELAFARTDPSGLIYDSTDPAFDQAAIDNLARLQARVGSVVDAPFLRVDGSNEMNAGITFINGAMVTPDGTDLDIMARGNFVVNTGLTAPTIEATTSLTVNPPAGVLGAGFDRFDQSQEVADNRIDIDTNATNIATNTTNIGDNTTNIATNTTNIGDNTTNIATNTANIGTNTADIATNTAGITTNRGNIATNTGNIGTNAANIATNTAGIATNRGRIATNTAGITSNDSDIANHDTRITSNDSDIANHNTRITAVERRPATTWPPRRCTPSEATVRSRLGRSVPCQDIRSCEGGCGVAVISTDSGTYQVRSLSTLSCVSRTATVYTRCCLRQTEGNCSPYCESVTQC